MLSDNITVCIFAMNEEKRIERCINNFNGLFENIVVIDNYSTDSTKNIANSLGCRCVEVKNPGYAETNEVMDKVLAVVDTDYILVASVSEFVPVELLERYSQVAETGSHAIVRAFRQSVTAGLAIPISGQPKSYKHTELRFFKKGAVDYRNNKVHDRGTMVCPMDEVLVLLEPRYWFYQFRDYDCNHTEIKHAGYNNVLAKQMYDSGVRFSWLKMFYYASKQFANPYLRFGAWRYGMPGFIQSFYRFYMEVGIWFRIWEWENGFDAACVRQKNSEFRASLESQLERAKDGK